MNPIQLSERLWHFAARVVKVVDALPDTRAGRHVMIRCGTAAPPNYDEGRVTESRADFSHKINVALKELVETEGWQSSSSSPSFFPGRKWSRCETNALSYVESSMRRWRQPKAVESSLPMTNRCSILNAQ